MVPLRSAGRTADRGRKPPQICQPRHDHRREVRPNRPATPPFSPIMARHRRRLAAEKDPACGTQRRHLLVAAPHRRPTAPAHPPERLPTTQQLVKESCTVSWVKEIHAMSLSDLTLTGLRGELNVEPTSALDRFEQTAARFWL